MVEGGAEVVRGVPQDESQIARWQRTIDLRAEDIASAIRVILTEAWPRAAAMLVAGEPLVEIGGRTT